MALSYSFNYIGAIPSLICYINFGLGTGGPIVMFWGFVINSIFTIMTAYCLAEICSAYPKNGSVYVWSKKLCNNKWS